MQKRTILNLASKFGQGQRVLDLYYDATADPYHLDVDEQIAEYEITEDECEGTVLFPITEGGLTLTSFSSCVLAHAFRVRGYEPRFVLCYDDLDICIRKHRSPDDNATCETCYHAGTSTQDAFGIERVPLSALSERDGQSHSFTADERPVEYRGVDISTYAASTTRKFLQKFRINLDDPDNREVYERLLSTAAHLVDIAYELFEQYDTSAVFSQNPAYIYGGIYLDVAHQLDIPAYSIGTGWQEQRLQFGSPQNRSMHSQFEDDTHIGEILDTELSSRERTRTNDIMISRRDGSSMGIDYIDGADRSIDKQDDKTVIGMFTNLIWDASLAAGCPLFNDPYEWILSTISYFANQSDIHLVIKPHPAEAVIGTERGVADEINSAYESLPENIELLPPETDVNPYEMLDDLDAGIVWNSTIGLEMAYFSVPVIVAGETHYRGFNFTFDPDHVDGYYELLDDIADLETDERMVARARRYAHYLFFRKSIPFPYIETHDDSLGGHGLPVTHEEIVEDQVLDFVVDRVIADEPVVLPREFVDPKHYVTQ